MKKLIIPLALILSACENSSSVQLDSPEGMTVFNGVSDSAVGQESGTTRLYNKTRATNTSASAPVPPPTPDTNNNNPSGLNFLAYRYNYGFRLPARAVAATSKSHAQTCLDAGPRLCQVINSSTSAYNEDNVTANLSLRAEPDWLEGFKTSMQSSVEAAKGKMTNNSVSAEDLTRQILDTDARLKAQKTLRDRLQGLLATRDAKLNDLLALERELARVQSQIESATTTLNVLRKRVSMSVVNINYQRRADFPDFILMPTGPQTAFAFGEPVPANQADFTAFANLADRPAVQFPIGFNQAGLPIGAQLIGPRGGEADLVETMHGLWQQINQI